MLIRPVHTAIAGTTLLALIAFRASAQEPAAAPAAHHMDIAIEHHVAAADTSPEHAASAKRFYDEADHLDKEAAQHEKDAADYRQRARLLPKANYANLAAHCDRLSTSLRAAAAEARETARLHEDIARLVGEDAKH